MPRQVTLARRGPSTTSSAGKWGGQSEALVCQGNRNGVMGDQVLKQLLDRHFREAVRRDAAAGRGGECAGAPQPSFQGRSDGSTTSLMNRLASTEAVVQNPHTH